MKISPFSGGTPRGRLTALPSTAGHNHDGDTPTSTTQARTRSPQAYQRAFQGLPEKRKHKLTRVVAGITQTQGKLAAQ